MDIIKQGLELFCKASAQWVNLSKSQLFCSLNIQEQLTYSLSQRLEVPLTKELGKYYGLEIIHQGPNKKLHARILEKINGRLEGCKTR